MDSRPKSRQQKLLDTLYPYFGDLAQQYGDREPLQICRMLRKRGDTALSNPWSIGFVSEWDAHHPEEEELTLGEFHWALKNFDENISAQTVALREQHHAAIRATFTVINGGKSANPDIPYVNTDFEVQEYEDY